MLSVAEFLWLSLDVFYVKNRLLSYERIAPLIWRDPFIYFDWRKMTKTICSHLICYLSTKCHPCSYRDKECRGQNVHKNTCSRWADTMHVWHMGFCAHKKWNMAKEVLFYPLGFSIHWKLKDVSNNNVYSVVLTTVVQICLDAANVTLT